MSKGQLLDTGEIPSGTRSSMYDDDLDALVKHHGRAMAFEGHRKLAIENAIAKRDEDPEGTWVVAERTINGNKETFARFDKATDTDNREAGNDKSKSKGTKGKAKG